jgi:phage baseplate assembly protein gpV
VLGAVRSSVFSVSLAAQYETTRFYDGTAFSTDFEHGRWALLAMVDD